MSPTALDALRARIQRTLNVAQRQSAEGFTQSHVLYNGMRHSYSVTGVKSPEQLEDELLVLFVWAWRLKDHLQHCYRANKLDPKIVDEAVNGSDRLQFIADIANRA